MHRVIGTDTDNNMVFTLSVCLDTLSLSQCMANVIFNNIYPGMQNSESNACKQNSNIPYPIVRERLIYWLHVTIDLKKRYHCFHACTYLHT